MFAKVRTLFLILAILLIALFSPIPQARPTVMKRESRIIFTSLDEALDFSLAAGDGRLVRWA